MNIDFLEDSEVQRLMPPITQFLAPIQTNKALAEIAQATRKLITAEEREAFLRQPYKAHDGAPTALNGQPRFVAFLALHLLARAKAKAETTFRHTEDAMRHNFMDTVKAFFEKPMELEERLHVLFFDATHTGRNDDQGDDAPRNRIRKMLAGLGGPDSIFYRTNGGEYGVAWKPVADALKHRYVRHAVRV